jgi:hypothetical protein
LWLLLLLQVFRVVASILKLANLIFIPTTNMDGTEGCTVGNEYGEWLLMLFTFQC